MDSSSRYRRWALWGCSVLVGLFGIFVLSYAHLFGAPGTGTAAAQFVVSPDEPLGEIADRLKTEGLIRTEWAFRLAFVKEAGIGQVRPGGYEISPDMDAWSVASTFAKSPYIAWVTIPQGMRKEQIADLLAKDLSWTDAQKQEWIATDTDPSPSYEEGVYAPGTYLIPSDQTPAQVAQRLRDRFASQFAPYAAEAAQQGVKWTSVLTIASLIEREAAGPDMKLIAGILWNRLDTNMALQVDATLQYVKGNDTDGWWPIVHSADKYLDSPFNTYEHTGLPPHPIAEPSLAAIDAVLNPEATKCIFYLHDDDGQIHCSANYAGQVANVNKYLK